MTTLTKEQAQSCFNALNNHWGRSNYVMSHRFAYDDGFKHGFEAAINLQDKKLMAYAAFINGSITRAELDEVLKDET